MRRGPSTRMVVAGQDWGYTKPGALNVWCVDGDGRIIMVREHYHTRRLIDWWVDKAVMARRDWGVDVFVCDPSEPAFIAEYRRAGLHAIGADNDIEAGIQAMQVRFNRTGDGRPRLYLCEGVLQERDESLVEARQPTCLRDELDVYVYHKDAGGRSIKERPVDEHNHALDAGRYVCLYVDGKCRVIDGKPNAKPDKVVPRGVGTVGARSAFGGGARPSFSRPPRGVF